MLSLEKIEPVVLKYRHMLRNPVTGSISSVCCKCTMGTSSHSWGSNSQGVLLTTNPLLVSGWCMGGPIHLPPHYACLACNRTVFTVYMPQEKRG